MSPVYLDATMEVYRGVEVKLIAQDVWSGDFTPEDETVVFIDILASV